MNLITLLIAIAIVALLMVLFLRASLRSHVHTSTQPPRNKGMHRTWRKIYLAPVMLQRLIGWLPFQRPARMEVQFANIGEGNYQHGIKSYLPDAATSARYLMYKKGTDVDHSAICGLNDDPLGPSDDQADVGIPIAIKLLGAVYGTVRVVTDGTIADGDYVKCGATGKVTKAASTDLSFGRAVIPTDASANDTDVITIRPALPAKYVF